MAEPRGPAPAGDELTQRVRALEAERLRPTPPPPARVLGPPAYADLPALVHEMATAPGRRRPAHSRRAAAAEKGER